MSSAIPITRGNSHPYYANAGSPTTSPVTHSPILGGSITFKSLIGTARPKVLRPFAVGELRLLLLENISEEAVQSFKSHGFQVDHFKKAWSEDELVEKIGLYHAIGIRSKTKITERVLQHAPKVRSRVSKIDQM